MDAYFLWLREKRCAEMQSSLQRLLASAPPAPALNGRETARSGTGLPDPGGCFRPFVLYLSTAGSFPGF